MQIHLGTAKCHTLFQITVTLISGLSSRNILPLGHLSHCDTFLALEDFNDKCDSWDNVYFTTEIRSKLYDLAHINTYTQFIAEPKSVCSIYRYTS